MGWKQAGTNDLPEGTQLRVEGRVGVIVRVIVRFGEGDFIQPPARYVGFLPHDSDYVSLHHVDQVEYWESEPEPKAPEYRETNYYIDTATGTVYYHSGRAFPYIAVNSIKESLARPLPTFKRLYREV